MSDFVLHVTRADDLLRLRLEFTNLMLDPDETRTPRRLVRALRPDDAFMTIFLPPQHISEFNFTENSDGTLSRLPRPGHRVRVFSAGESRLGFRLRPEFDSISLALDELLDFSRFEPVLALTSADALADPTLPPRVVSEPLQIQTAIELPFRLAISPEESARWIKSTQPVTREGRTELWHMRLAPVEGQAHPPQLWAIWSPDVEVFASPNDFPMSLSMEDRRQIVRISSDFKLLHPSNFHVLNSQQSGELARLRAERSQRLAGEQLMLSALGGWLKASSRFHFPSLGELASQMTGEGVPASGDLFSLQQWTHVAIMGRDQHVRVVKHGYLFPFGHRAELTKVVERKFKRSRDPNGEEPAFLANRTFLGVQEIERSFDTRDMPFKSVRMLNLLSSAVTGDTGAGFFVPKVAGRPFAFPVSVTDRQDRTFEAAIPMVFVPDDQVHRLEEIARAYQDINRVDLRRQPIAFAEGTQEAILKAIAIAFKHQEIAAKPPFHPVMQEAEVSLPAAEQLLGETAVTRIAYDPRYIQDGPGHAIGDVFVNILDPGGLNLTLPPDKAGGVAAPHQTLHAISRIHGAVPKLQMIGQDIAPANLDFIDGTLLGVIKLKDAIGPVKTSAHMPKMVTTPGSTEFSWLVPLRSDTPSSLPKPLTNVGSAVPMLNLKGTMRTAPTGTVFEVIGSLANFGIAFLNTVQVDFASLKFHMVTHRKPAFEADITGFGFLGHLAFLDKLSKCLPLNGFGGGAGPALALSPEGVTAGLARSIPNIELGALVAKNLALSAQLSLFFAKPAQLRFALSSREHPFLIAYSLLGGGGFFALTVAAEENNIQVEAAIEFGAIAAIDLFIARGEVQSMVGVLLFDQGWRRFARGIRSPLWLCRGPQDPDRFGRILSVAVV